MTDQTLRRWAKLGYIDWYRATETDHRHYGVDGLLERELRRLIEKRVRIGIARLTNRNGTRKWYIASSKVAHLRAGTARAVGYALFAAQQGEKHEDAKVLKGFGDAAVLEVIARHDGDTFRAVYTVRFGEVVYVLQRSRSAASPRRRRSWS